MGAIWCFCGKSRVSFLTKHWRELTYSDHSVKGVIIRHLVAVTKTSFSRLLTRNNLVPPNDITQEILSHVHFGFAGRMG